ncbi:MAG TPA: hypothetical protein VGM05_02030 [Planctomycetaceae bacterium]|jgi:hypothetical protein
MVRRILIVGFCMLWTAPPASAAERKGVRPLAEFEIAPDGDFVLLPLIIHSREYRFLVCTGLSTTVIDEKLRDELELPAAESRNTGGNRGKKRYKLGARLGNFDLTFPAGVETGDYTTMREGLDLDFHGELGMDVLQRYIVQIDFDEGILRFLPAVPTGSGEAIRIFQQGQEYSVPILMLTVPGEKSQRFFVSTGRAGNSLDVDNKFLEELEEDEHVTVLSKEKAVARTGTRSFQTVRIESIQIGSFRHEGIIANSGEGNSVGLSYLSRYLVTFDFPRARMYLKKGANFDTVDAPLNMWQVAVERDEKSVTVTQINPHGPAARLGLLPGDRIETLNERHAERLSSWQIRRVLGRCDLPLAAEVIRDGNLVTLKSEPLAGEKIPNEKVANEKVASDATNSKGE